ncbi:MAG: HlyD family secretion protein [Telluria sp.]
MTPQLFRAEVLLTKNSRFAGEILLAQPVLMKCAAITSVLLVLLFAIFVLEAEYTRKVRVTGQLVAAMGAVKVVAPRAGQISARRVSEGQFVRAGEVLYEFSSERNAENVGLDSRIYESLAKRRKLLFSEREVQETQIRDRAILIRKNQISLQLEIGRIDQELALQMKRVQEAELNVARYKELKVRGYISEVQLNQQESESGERLARWHSLERSKVIVLREAEQSAVELRQVEGQAALEEIQHARALSVLDQETMEHRGASRFQVVAPITGIITAVTGQTGESLPALSSIATVIPADSEFEVRLFAPSRAVGLVEPDQKIQMRIDAFPYQKFGQLAGRVAYVEQSPVVEPTVVAHGAPTFDPIYRVVVKLDQHSLRKFGRNRRLKGGMVVEADILQERRPLINWILDPLNSLLRSGSDARDPYY